MRRNVNNGCSREILITQVIRISEPQSVLHNGAINMREVNCRLVVQQIYHSVCE